MEPHSRTSAVVFQVKQFTIEMRYIFVLFELEHMFEKFQPQ